MYAARSSEAFTRRFIAARRGKDRVLEGCIAAVSGIRADTSSFDTTQIACHILTPDTANERALFDITQSYAAKRLPPIAVPPRRPVPKTDAPLRMRFFYGVKHRKKKGEKEHRCVETTALSRVFTIRDARAPTVLTARFSRHSFFRIVASARDNYLHAVDRGQLKFASDFSKMIVIEFPFV